MLHIIFNQRSYLLIQHLVRLSDQDHVKNNLIENFFRILKNELLYSQGISFHGTPQTDLIEYPDCCNNRRIKVKQKGLPPAIHRQQALSVA